MKTSSKLIIGVYVALAVIIIGVVLASRYLMISDKWGPDGGIAAISSVEHVTLL
jgi:hypothetical protein